MIYNTYKNRKRRKISNLPVTISLIIITSIISVIAFILFSIRQDSISYFAIQPNMILSGNYLWTLILHMFVHGGALHLFINMFVLFSLGVLSEKIIGRRRFLWLYLSSGIFAGLLSVVLSFYFGNSEIGARIFGNPSVYMLGASGAIFAIAGLFVVLLPKLRFTIIFLPFFSLPAYVMVPLVLFLTWIVTIAANLPVGNVAHLGGFLVGAAYGLYLKSKYKRKVQMLRQMFQ